MMTETSGVMGLGAPCGGGVRNGEQAAAEVFEALA